MINTSPFICPKCGHELNQAEIKKIYTFWHGPIPSKCGACSTSLSLNMRLKKKFKIAAIILKLGLLFIALWAIAKLTSIENEWFVLSIFYLGVIMSATGLFMAKPIGNDILVITEK